jgi:hypothetical protein
VEPILCFGPNGATLDATVNVPSVVPSGYVLAYVLTQGPDRIVQGLSSTPTFIVSAIGAYTIHTLVYEPATGDPEQIIVFGVTTGAEVEALFVEGGGTICGSLDLQGVIYTVLNCCPADAGTLTADVSTICYTGPTTISATANGDAVVPNGYETIYVLTTGQDLVIQAVNADPSFEVDAVGLHTIHTLVYDPTTLDLGTIVFGTTTGGDVNALLLQGGGGICAGLDVAGAPVIVENCCDADAGAITADDGVLCYPNVPVTISATPNGDAVVPAGFETIYVLTSGQTLVIQSTSPTASFQVSAPGAYTIHTLVYDPATLDLGIVVPGQTTGGDVNALLVQGGGTICASLDVTGAPILVEDCRPANDDCSAAIEVAVSVVDDCAANAVAGNNTYATAELGSVPSCDETTLYYADVWYRFNSGENTLISILFDAGTMTSWGIAVSDACTGGTELACEIDPAVPVDITTQPNTDYWVRIYSDLGSGSGGEFTLCVSGTTPTYICDGASVILSDGSTNVTICQDGDPDVLDLLNTSNSIEAYDYVVTDEQDVIVAPMAMGSLDFNALPLGTYRVWGVSHNGSLQAAMPASALADVTSAGACIDISDDFVTVNVEICSGIAQRNTANWNLFPNPTSGLVYVRYSGEGTSASIEVFDMGGRIVATQRAGITSGRTIGLQGGELLAPGSYTVRLNDGRAITTMRLTVQ